MLKWIFDPWLCELWQFVKLKKSHTFHNKLKLIYIFLNKFLACKIKIVNQSRVYVLALHIAYIKKKKVFSFLTCKVLHTGGPV